MRDEAIYLAIGRRLRARRRLVDMTQAQVAAHCGLTFQQIQKYEAGMVAMPVARLVLLAEVLQAPLSELMGDLQSVTRLSREPVSWRRLEATA